MTSANRIRFFIMLLLIITIVAISGVNAANAEQTALQAIIADYQDKCQAMQSEALPEIDADPDAPSAKGILTLDQKDVYDVEISAHGKSATVVFADFQCSNFGHPWCGSGGCSSYLIVNDTVFEWLAGGKPIAVKDNTTVLLTRPIGGYGCKDSEGKAGFGASPCYELAIWDEARGTFWSENGDLRLLSNFPAP